jgi:hypothetical protein
MKRGGHVKKMNVGGKPHEDEPMRQAKRKAKELTTERGIEPEEKASAKGEMKYARGGRVGDETYNAAGHIAGHRGHGKHVIGGEGKLDLTHLHKAHSDHVKSVKVFAKGGVVVKGKALDKPDGGTAKEEKASAKGEMRYARGGHVKSFPHGTETKGKTRGKYI